MVPLCQGGPGVGTASPGQGEDEDEGEDTAESFREAGWLW